MFSNETPLVVEEKRNRALPNRVPEVIRRVKAYEGVGRAKYASERVFHKSASHCALRFGKCRCRAAQLRNDGSATVVDIKYGMMDWSIQQMQIARGSVRQNFTQLNSRKGAGRVFEYANQVLGNRATVIEDAKDSYVFDSHQHGLG